MADIKLENITKSFNGRNILENFSLSINDGECFSILGPSPCGKTTVLRTICGFERIDEGEISIGKSIVTSKKRRIFLPPEKRDIGIVFQDYAVWPHMTAFENVFYPLKKRKMDKETAKQKALDSLKQVKMENYIKRLPHQLSGGQQQRIALARALVTSEKVILLDEPLCNLDANLREEMRFEIKELQKHTGTTIVLVTQDHSDALAISDRLAVMDINGRIRQIGKPENIYKEPADSYVFRFLGLSNFIPLRKQDNRLVIQGIKEKTLFPYPRDPKLKNDHFFAAFRPDDVELSKITGTKNLKGVIKRVIFLGDIFEYRVDLNGLEIRIQQDSFSSSGNRFFEQGDNCELKIKNIRYYEKLEEV
jgi:iron(III) transport system ATP-binding protein